MYGVVLLLLARVNACLVLEWYCDEATGVQKRAQAAAVQQRKDLGPRTWKSTADSSSLLTSIIHSPSQRLTYSLSLFLLFLSVSLSPPSRLLLRVPLSDDTAAAVS
jgi:hypothetical protein